MYCVKCGRQIEKQAQFCPFCGQSTQVETVSSPPINAAPRTDMEWGAPAGASDVKPKKSTQRRRWLLGCAVMLFALIFLCSGSLTAVYFWLGLNRAHQIAEIAPAETTAYISINPTIWQLPQLRHFDKLTQGGAVLAAVPGVAEVGLALQALPFNLTLDPQRDILPWVGNEVSLAIISESAVPGRGGGEPLSAQAAYAGPTFILAAVSRDAAASDALLLKIQRQLEGEGVLFEQTDYRALQITEIISPTATPLAWATVNNLLVLASDGATLQNALDAALDGSSTSLGAQPAFQQAVSNLSRNRLGYMVIQGDSLRQWVDWETELWQGIETLALTMALERDGLRLNYALKYDTALLLPSQLAFLENSAAANTLAANAPANAIFYLSGNNLPLLWEAALNNARRDMARTLRDETRIRLEDDLLALASGNYALAAIADREGFLSEPNMPYAALLLTEVADQRMADRELSGAARRFSERYYFPFYQDELSRTSVQILQFHGAGLIGYGFLDNVLFVGSSEDALRAAARAPNSSLAGNQLYQTANRLLPDDGNIYLYVDVQSLIRASYETGSIREQERFDKELRPFLSGIRAVAATAAPMNRQGVIQGVLFVVTD